MDPLWLLLIVPATLAVGAVVGVGVWLLWTFRDGLWK